MSQMQLKLTPCEQEIFNMLLEGISPKDISVKLNISDKTVDFHKTNLFRKLSVSSIQELITKYSAVVQFDSALQIITEKYELVEKQPADLQNKTEIKLLVKKHLVKLIAAGLFISISVFFIWYFILKSSGSFYPISMATEENPLTLTLYENEPWGYAIGIHIFPSGESLLSAGEILTFHYTFISDIDIHMLFFTFADITDTYTMLSPNTHIKGNIIAYTEYSGKVTVILNRTASSKELNANQFNLSTNLYTGNQPTITFTRFIIEKNN